jgi:serine/threonine-protein kinase
MDKQPSSSGPTRPASAVPRQRAPEEATELLQTQEHASKPPAVLDDATELDNTEARQAKPTDLQNTQAHTAAEPAMRDTSVHERTEPADNISQTEAMESSGGPNDKTQTAGQSAVVPKEQKVNKLGDYRLQKKLGEGGMGSVYKAHQESLDRPVAVKVLFKHLAANPSFVERFQREAKIMAKLDHTNILRCFGVGEEHGWHYLAMEFIDGGSMQGWLDKLGKLSIGDALRVTIDCTHALQHAHEMNLIHRDIKPDNILVTNKGVVKVADMGLAKAHGENLSLTRTGTAAGTPIYMSPEQARDAKRVDHRTDIYALGCMLYTFIAGKYPIQAETYIELLEAKEKGKFEPLRKHSDEVPERLDLIVDKMLAKRVESRYQSCEEVLRDLEGLGLANDKLSFLAGPEQSSAKSKAPAKPSSRPAAADKKPTMKEAPAARPKFKTDDDPEGNWWYVAFRGHDGKPIRRKMTHQQLREMIADPSFDIKAQASRTLEGGYRAIATFPEFENLLRGRISKMQADRKAQKFHNIYSQLEKEEISRRRWRWLRNLYLKTGGLVIFLIWMAVIGAIIVALYFGVRHGFNWLGDKVQHLND